MAAYLPDEPEHAGAVALLDGPTVLLTGTLTRVEVAGALSRATRASRLPDLVGAITLLERDLSQAGPVTVLQHPQDQLEDRAMTLCLTHGLRAMDALHLAVAELAGRPLADPGEDLVFLTSDALQREAAEALGFPTAL